MEPMSFSRYTRRGSEEEVTRKNRTIFDELLSTRPMSTTAGETPTLTAWTGIKRSTRKKGNRFIKILCLPVLKKRICSLKSQPRYCKLAGRYSKWYPRLGVYCICRTRSQQGLDVPR